jgi:hypothetical protein
VKYPQSLLGQLILRAGDKEIDLFGLMARPESAEIDDLVEAEIDAMLVEFECEFFFSFLFALKHFYFFLETFNLVHHFLVLILAEPQHGVQG